MSDYLKAAVACDPLSTRAVAYSSDAYLATVLDTSKKLPSEREPDWHHEDDALEQAREQQRQRMTQELAELKQHEQTEAEAQAKGRKQLRKDEEDRRRRAQLWAE
eukprot:RCo013690